MPEKQIMPLMPENLVKWYDIAKGVAEVALHAAFDAIHHEAKPVESTHFRETEF